MKVTKTLDDSSDRLFKHVACQEIISDFGPEDNFLIKNGVLTARNEQYCNGLQLTKPFDSAKFQLRTPIYYFEGTLDPATPIAQARYHFEHQTKAPRVFFEVEGAGHATLSKNLELCRDAIWAKISEGRSDFGALIESCGLPVRVEQTQDAQLPVSK